MDLASRPARGIRQKLAKRRLPGAAKALAPKPPEGRFFSQPRVPGPLQGASRAAAAILVEP